MADSVGSGFPSTGINKGHTFYDIDEGSTWVYIGGIPRLVSSWRLINGIFVSDPDTSTWGEIQSGATWFNTTELLVKVWNGTAITTVGGGSTSFSALTSGTNVQADMVVGNTASLSVTGADKGTNGNYLYSHDPGSLDSASGPFTLVYSTFPGVNGQAGLRQDSTWHFGYNMNNNITPIVAGDPAFGLSYENCFSLFPNEFLTTISNITNANPAVVTYVGADNFTNGMSVIIKNIDPGTLANALNNKVFQIANVNTGANTFELLLTSTLGLSVFSGPATVARTYLVFEWHLQQINTNGQIRRPISLTVPWAGEGDSVTTSNQSATGFNANVQTFNTYNGTQRLQMNWSLGTVDFVGDVAAPITMRFGNASSDTYRPLQVRNAANSIYLAYPYYDSFDVLRVGGVGQGASIYVQGRRGGAGATWPSQTFTIWSDTSTSGDIILAIVNSALTAGICVVINAYGATNGDVKCEIWNQQNTAGVVANAILELRVLRDDPGGDPYVLLFNVGIGGTAQSTAIGMDNSDANAFVISTGGVPGSSNVLRIATLVNGGVLTSSGTKSVTTQFDKTNDTTLANVTGLSITLEAALKYRFRAVLHTSSNVAGGVKFAIAGTATATNIIYQITYLDNAAGTNLISARQTALAGASGVTATVAGMCMIEGELLVNAAGTLTVQFAQNALNGAASSVLVGSTFEAQGIF